jgi:predicted MFS family arabinose efflux permease
LLYGVFGGLAGAAQGGQIVGAIVPKWFIRRRGSAMAWATMGTALSVMTVPPAVAVLLATVDWRPTWGIVAAVSFLFAAVPAVLLRRQPEDLGLLPDGDATPRTGRPAPPPTQEASWTLSEAARTPQFYLLAVAVAIGSLSIVGVPVSLVALYTGKGLSTELAVAGYSLYGLFSVIGRFFWGYFINRYHVRWVLTAVAAVGAVAMPLLLVVDGPAALLCAALVGLANGGQFGFGPMVWPVYFGRLHLGSITGVTRPLTTLVIGSGSGMMALTYDWTGSYSMRLLLITAAWVLSGVGMLLARPLHVRGARGVD